MLDDLIRHHVEQRFDERLARRRWQIGVQISNALYKFTLDHCWLYYARTNEGASLTSYDHGRAHDPLKPRLAMAST